jgi:hypothetical protein
MAASTFVLAAEIPNGKVYGRTEEATQWVFSAIFAEKNKIIQFKNQDLKMIKQIKSINPRSLIGFANEKIDEFKISRASSGIRAFFGSVIFLILLWVNNNIIDNSILIYFLNTLIFLYVFFKATQFILMISVEIYIWLFLSKITVGSGIVSLAVDEGKEQIISKVRNIKK